MKTRGTANLDLLTDGELKHLLAACCLDVYEGAVLGDEELEFALGTLDRFMAERHRRIAARRPILSIGDTADDLAELDEDLGPPIFPDGGPIEGGAVQYEPLEDSGESPPARS